MSHVEAIEQVEPEVVPAATPALLPPTEAEVRQVLTGIDRLIERNPNVAADPTTLLLVRLGLAFLDGPQRTAKVIPVEDSREVRRLIEENNSLGDRLLAAEEAAEDARMIAEDAQGQVDNLMDDLAKTKKHLEDALQRPADTETDRLKSELRAIQEVLEDPTKKLSEPSPLVTKVQGVLADLAKMTTEYGASQTAVAALENRVKTEKDAVSKARGEVRAAQKEVKDIKGAIREIEYGALSSQYTFRQTGKKIPCCPSCGGLDPSKVDKTPQAGHRRGCWIQNFVSQYGR